MKTIIINPYDKTITEDSYSGDYKDIYNLIDCNVFTIVSIDKQNDLILDDNGLLHNNQMFFFVKGIDTQAFAGKSMILSHDGDGDARGTTLTVDAVEDLITWAPEGYVEEPQMNFVSW
jgi:hypothetical protein|tara:strand:+ start:87 stop:440 length:354 start_codon:yes stop_codon:yes gene_type:complete